MQFTRIFRPKLCQFVKTVHSCQTFNRCLLPLTSQLNFVRGESSDAPDQTSRSDIQKITLKPLNFDYSDDQVKQEPLDPNDIVFKYRDIPDIKELPEHLKKLFTLRYATSQERLEHRNAELLDKVSDVVGAGPCLEKEICFLTVKIRNLIPYIVGNRGNKKHKSYLIERINKRKRLLRLLRKMDYDRFLWLLKELQLSLSPVNRFDYFKFQTVSRRGRLGKIARKKMLRKKNRKMKHLRLKFDKQKKEFYQLKEEMLKEIDRDIAELGLDKVKILTDFKNRLDEERKERIEKSKKLTRVQKYILEMREKKEKESRVF